MGSIQLVAFGTHTWSGTPEDCHRNSKITSGELIASLREEIGIVAFNGNISYGNIGSDQRFTYTIVVPKFDRFLAALLNTEFGRLTELGALS
jgi:hypothetical protein